MIYTVTLNPSIDYYLQVEEFLVGEVNRAEKNYKCPGGKGINVSRVLKRLDTDSIALGFIGGFTGRYIDRCLKNEGIYTDFIMIEEDTRINVKISGSERTDENGKSRVNSGTEINGQGPYIKTEKIDELFEKLNRLTDEDFVVLAGNVQRSIPRDIYSKIQKRCSKTNAKIIVDTTGEVLTLTLENRPFLIKPNLYELSEIFKSRINSKEEVINYGKKLIDLGAENVIVSMEGEGAILVSNMGAFYSIAPKGLVKNSVGSGDSLIGGFLANYSKSQNILESFKWGIAAGSATAFSQDLCKIEDVKRLLKEVNIKKLV